MTANHDDLDHQPRRTSTGGGVSLRDYFERVLQERRREHETEHRAHDRQHETMQEVMDSAHNTLDVSIQDAKNRIGERHGEVVRRLETLESGGAPFASRLDDSLKTLKSDVETLKEKGVRQEAIEALRETQTKELAAQKKQLRLVLIAAGVSFAFSLILLGIQLAT